MEPKSFVVNNLAVKRCVNCKFIKGKGSQEYKRVPKGAELIWTCAKGQEPKNCPLWDDWIEPKKTRAKKVFSDTIRRVYR